jgi:hypothetical protein
MNELDSASNFLNRNLNVAVHAESTLAKNFLAGYKNHADCAINFSI